MDIFEKLQQKKDLDKERITNMINSGCGHEYSWSQSEWKVIKMFNLTKLMKAPYESN
jgi:hypothetical protein